MGTEQAVTANHNIYNFTFDITNAPEKTLLFKVFPFITWGEGEFYKRFPTLSAPIPICSHMTVITRKGQSFGDGAFITSKNGRYQLTSSGNELVLTYLLYTINKMEIRTQPIFGGIEILSTGHIFVSSLFIQTLFSTCICG